jgi:hypothetical protein
VQPRDQDLKIRGHNLELDHFAFAGIGQLKDALPIIIEVSQNQDIDRNRRNNTFCFINVAEIGNGDLRSFISVTVNVAYDLVPRTGGANEVLRQMSGVLVPADKDNPLPKRREGRSPN